MLLFKNETHNHPTEIEPFGGAATCLGGCIRDPLSGRAYVYQAMRVTGAGDPHTSLEDTLEGKLYHYTYDNWHQFFEKFNKYTTAAANKYKEQGKSCSFLGDIILRPTWAFFKIYILQGGILDGKIGFLLSIYHMMYTMTKYVKLYYLNKSNGQL